MRRQSVFWAIILIVAGVLFLLDNLGALAPLGVSAWALIGPLLLIALGLWVLWGVASGRPSVEAEQAAIPLGGAGRARVRVQHAAGRLRIVAGAGPGELAAGVFGGGLDCRARREGDLLAVEMRMPSHAWPVFGPWSWGPGGALDWSFGLSERIPLELDLETGASDTQLDLSGLQVTDLRLKTGASATSVTLPANAGHTRARVEAGAASLDIRVPAGVAARIRVEGALTAVDVDTARFPRAGGAYESPDYDTAANRVELTISAAVGSVSVR